LVGLVLLVAGVLAAAALVPFIGSTNSSLSQSSSRSTVSSTLQVCSPPSPSILSASPVSSTVWQNITYGIVGNAELKLDIYYPTDGSPGPWPLVVDVHGGGWEKGDKSAVANSIVLPPLRSAGLAVASVNYRLAPNYQFPAQIEDVKCAVRFLSANAPQLRIDPSRIGAWGQSAGGHLVSLLGLTNETAGWDLGAYPGYSSSVVAVADWFGPENLTDIGFNNIHRTLFSQVFGVSISAGNISSYALAKLRTASPINYVTIKSPPFVIFQGVEDVVVPENQSLELFHQLRAKNVTASLVLVQNAGHGFVPTPPSAQINPSIQQIANQTVNFFVQYVRDRSSVQGAKGYVASALGDGSVLTVTVFCLANEVPNPNADARKTSEGVFRRSSLTLRKLISK
jgi:acetyl esterase/lipase